MTNQTKWDFRWLETARVIASFSKDPSTQTGAIILRPDHSVAAVGYNGFPRKMLDKEEWLNNRKEKYSRMVHCEMNAILSMKESAHGCTLYTWPFLSCDRCAVHMIQAGIIRVVAPACPEDKKDRWEENLKRTVDYFTHCDVEVTQYEIL